MPQQPSQPRDYKLIVEKDVVVPLRDGAILYADVYRPDGGSERFPAIMNIGPYQKDKLWIPPDDLEEKAEPVSGLGDRQSDVVVPARICLRACRCARIRQVTGRSDPSSYQEAVDFYDAIEWIARRDWCSGNIGTLGISYHANCQWRVANLQPPSLKAIIPWEGRADLYRDQTFHGGIFAMGFLHTWIATNMAHHLMGRPRTTNPDAFNNNMLWEWASHNLDSEFWRMRSAQWDKITVPLYSVGNWTGVGLHLRGNTEGFMNAASKSKKLRIHTGTHFHPFHTEEGRLDQLRFFDHWLKGIDTGIMAEPPVKLQIRTGGGLKDYKFRFETSGRSPHALDQNVSEGRATRAEPRRQPGRRAAVRSGHGRDRDHLSGQPAQPCRNGVGRAVGQCRLDRADRGVVHHGAARGGHRDHRAHGAGAVGVQHVEDMDIFATIRNIGPDGEGHLGGRAAGLRQVPVAKGWLRAAHRKLDRKKSLPYRPYHTHDERQWLKPGEVVECQVEIWPSCMVFKQGHRIRLDVQPTRRRRRLGVSALSGRLQYRREEYDSHRRRAAMLSAASGHPAKVMFRPIKPHAA
jgi:predicted acyl esterase